MITVKTKWEIEKMRLAGRAAAAARKAAGEAIEPGVTTAHIDAVVARTLREHGATASFYKYHGYPASVCVSINDEVIHGIPGARVICEGDIVKIDVGALISGYHGDTADTFTVGSVPEKTKKLIDITRRSFFEGMKMARAGNRISDISSAIGEFAEKNGFSVVRMFTGHGIGTNLHEDPEVPNFGHPGRGPRLIPGMTIAVEPMINEGGFEVSIMPDGWTVKTCDKSLSAHYEHTVLITEHEPELLTL